MKKISNVNVQSIPEILWLAAAVLIPLAGVSQYYLASESEMSHLELPKIALLRTLAGCMLILLLFQTCMGSRYPKSVTAIFNPSKLSPKNWILYSVTLFTVSTAITTILSSNFKVSMWGFTPGLDGYSAYNIISYVIIFTFITIHLKTRSQLERLLIGIIAMGVLISLIGFFQHFGVNIFRLLPSEDFSRATLTTGNSVAAGSLLLMTIGVTILAATIHLNRNPIHLRKNIPTITRLTIWSIVLAIQISAMLFSLSRGPWVATAGSVVLFLVLIMIFAGWRTTIFPTIVILLSATIALSISGIPTPYFQDVPNVKTGASGSSVSQRIQSIPSAIAVGGLNQRSNIWRASWILISERPWFESENLPLRPIRTIIGYGPGTFRYAFNLTAPPSLYGGLPLEANHAHNYFIHQAVSQGLLGFASAIVLLSAPILVSAYQLILRYRAHSQIYIITLCGVIAVASGRFAEQLIGFGKISDVTLFWILLALTVCMLNIINAVKSENEQIPVNHHINLNTKPWHIFMLTMLSLLIILFTWEKALIYPVSAHTAGISRNMYSNSNHERALIEINRSIQMTPGITHYYHLKHMILLLHINNSDTLTHSECAASEDKIAQINEYKKCIAEDIYSALLTSKLNNPYYFRSTIELADTAKQLGLETASLSFYEESVRLLPTNRPLLNLLAEEYFIRGMYDKALDTVNQSLKISQAQLLPHDPPKFYDDAINIRNRAIELQ